MHCSSIYPPFEIVEEVEAFISDEMLPVEVGFADGFPNGAEYVLFTRTICIAVPFLEFLIKKKSLGSK
jgi:hypothetical protein